MGLLTFALKAAQAQDVNTDFDQAANFSFTIDDALAKMAEATGGAGH